MKTSYQLIARSTKVEQDYYPYSLLSQIDTSEFPLDENPALVTDAEREAFKRMLFSSLSISLEDKKRVITSFAKLSSKQIEGLKGVLEEEQDRWFKCFSEESAEQRLLIFQNEIEACANYLQLALEERRNQKKIYEDYEIVPVGKLDHIWSAELSEDGATFVIGHGRDQAKLIQFDMQSSEILASYYLPGRYVRSTTFFNNSRLIVGTNNGHIAVIDLINRLVIQKVAIASESAVIRSLVAVPESNRIYVATTKKLIVLDATSLSIVCESIIGFEAWDLLVIPNSDMLAVAGKDNKVAFLKDKGNAIDTVCVESCGSPSRDVSSLMFNTKHKLVISASESGFLDFWQLSDQGVVRERRINVDDRLYWLVSCDNYVAVSGSGGRIYLYDIHDDLLIKIYDGRSGGKPALKEVDGRLLLLCQISKNEALVADLYADDWEIQFLRLKHDLANEMAVSDSGDVIIMLKNSLLTTRLFQGKGTPYSEYQQAVESILFNRKNSGFLLIQLEDSSVQVIDNQGRLIESILLPENDHCWKIGDFYDDAIIVKSFGKVALINGMGSEKVTIIDCSSTPSIKDVKILDHEHFAVLTPSLASATPMVEACVKVYDFNGHLVSDTSLGFSSNIDFVISNKLVQSEFREPSVLRDLISGESVFFDIGSIFDGNSAMFSPDDRLCVHLIFDQLMCAEVYNGGKRRWQVNDPRLASFRLLGFYSQSDGLMLFNYEIGELFLICCQSGKVLSRYFLGKDVYDLQLSLNGEWLAWICCKGKKHILACPFSHQINETLTYPWRTQYLEEQSGDAKLVLETVSVAEGWRVLQRRFQNLEFQSMQSPNHQLDPCGFKLKTPSLKALEKYDQQNALLSLLGLTSQKADGGRASVDVAIIYHELFHVFQANATTSVFDYFFLVDKLQSDRLFVLKHLGKIGFFDKSENDILKNCLSVFDCVESCQEEGLKRLGVLFGHSVQELLYYFSTAKDLDIQVFEIIEGSAEVFGLCCGGYQAFAELDQRILERENSDDQHIHAEMYTKAYKLFRQHGGRTPLLLLILSLVSLKYGAIGELKSAMPSEIFIWGLEKLPYWEDELEKKLVGKTVDIELFRKVSYELFALVRNGAQGRFYLEASSSIYDKPKNISNSQFMMVLGEIRGCYGNSGEIGAMLHLVSSSSLAQKLAEIINAYESRMVATHRLYRVLQDFEMLLLHTAYGDFKLYCCPIHGEVIACDDTWCSCNHAESLRILLQQEFQVIALDYFFSC